MKKKPVTYKQRLPDSPLMRAFSWPTNTLKWIKAKSPSTGTEPTDGFSSCSRSTLSPLQMPATSSFKSVKFDSTFKPSVGTPRSSLDKHVYPYAIELNKTSEELDTTRWGFPVCSFLFSPRIG